MAAVARRIFAAIEVSRLPVAFGAVANGFADITARTGKPVAFGVLTCQTVEQAIARSGGGDGARSKGNKGEEAMHAALIAARAVERIQRLPLGRPA